MDNNKKLFEGLLKADGINPANITESERMVFRQMLEREKKRINRLSWLSIGALWIFVIAILGLCVSEQILETLRMEVLHIPFIVVWCGLMAMMCFIFITRFPHWNRKIKESNKKISKLYYLVHGKHRGLILIGKKDGKRYIYWPHIIMFAAEVWLIMSLAGAGVHYLLCQCWIYSSSPMLHIFYCTVMSLSFAIFLLREGLKVPLDELVEVKAQSKQSKLNIARPDTWRLIMQSKITKFAIAAVIIIAVLVGINFLNGTTSWAEIIKAFNEVENVHFSSTTFELDGTKTEHQMYLKRPDCFYEDSAGRIIIDNGKGRLTIDKEKKTAQFSDSLLPYKPLEEHYMFRQLDIFRGENQNEYEITKIDEESSDTTIVFGLHYKSQSHARDLEIKAKAWVEADTMLPLKIRAEIVSESGENEPVRGEMVFDYKQIPDKVFALTVPEGYEQLPRKQRGVLSGKVFDENERPVVNAIVYCVDRTGYFSEQTTTDEFGQFTFKLPPEVVGRALWLPLMFRAFVEDNPNTVAWSVIKDPASKAEPGGNIPYEVGYVENKGSLLKSATEIILRMEPAGTIAGKVADADGNPIRNAKVRLHRCALADQYGNAGLTGIDVHKWSGHGDAGIVRTDENGRYELNNLPRLWKKTKFVVRAEAEGFVGDTTSFRAKGPMEYKELNFQLYKTGITVKGTLIDNYGEPLNERMMSVSVNGKYYRSCRTKTDSDGKFTLLNCPITGDLQVKAELSHNHWPSHERERYNSYVYYLDVIKGIDYQQGHLEYEIKMVAVLPELVLNVEVKNTDGILLKYFPVEIRGDAGPISSRWRVEKKLTRRTDENGRCTFTEVPDVKGLRLVLHGGTTILNEKLSDESKIFIAENKKKYFWAEVPVKIIDGQKEYNITAVALTRREYRKQEAAK